MPSEEPYAAWVQTVETALAEDPYTVCNRSLKDTATELHRALQNELAKAKARLAELEGQS